MTNELFWAVLSCGTVYYVVQGGCSFWICGRNPKVWPFKCTLLNSTSLWCYSLRWIRWFYLLSLSIKSWSVTIHKKATEQYFPVVLFSKLYRVVLTFESVYEFLKCDPSYESYWAGLFCGTVYNAVQGGFNVRVCRRNPDLCLFKRKPWATLSFFSIPFFFPIIYWHCTVNQQCWLRKFAENRKKSIRAKLASLEECFNLILTTHHGTYL